MNIRRIATLALVPIFLTACTNADDDRLGMTDDDRAVEQDWERDDDPMDREYEVGDEETVGLNEVRDSGVHGEAHFTVRAPSQTEVVLEIEDAPATSTLLARITGGTCDELEEIRDAPGGGADDSPGEEDDQMQRQDDASAHSHRTDGHEELELVMTDDQGKGTSTTTLGTTLDRLKEADHAVLLQDEQGQLVACGEVNGLPTRSW